LQAKVQAKGAGVMAERRRIPVAVVNGAGYGGVELLRLLRSHPVFELVEVTARSDVGKPVRAVFPHLASLDLGFSERVERSELVFLALPDHASIEMAPELLAEGRRIVDLSAGFRLREKGLYPTWYGYEHAAPALLETAVYGLTEWARDQLPEARLVANPGCYPTAALLALGPALKEDLIAPDVIVDAISGVSGAGRTLRLTSHFSEVNEDVTAYGVGGHRHWPEILQGMRKLASVGTRLTFTPHLAPITRGILATCYANLREGVSFKTVRAAYERAYADEPFVEFVVETPHTKWTFGSNRCFISATVDEHSQRLILISALDNLVKGAAGQAIQCANVMYGLSETLGLPREGVYP
jgi:N-acetyl-gamma-glutamyl-phosphate reductase